MHDCVQCGCACYCHGDIDDCPVETSEYAYEHCVGCGCKEDPDAFEDDDYGDEQTEVSTMNTDPKASGEQLAGNKRAEPDLTLDQRYWLDNRAKIIAALGAEGFQIWSDKDRFWLHRSGRAALAAEREAEPKLPGFDQAAWEKGYRDGIYSVSADPTDEQLHALTETISDLANIAYQDGRESLSPWSERWQKLQDRIISLAKWCGGAPDPGRCPDGEPHWFASANVCKVCGEQRATPATESAPEPEFDHAHPDSWKYEAKSHPTESNSERPDAVVHEHWYSCPHCGKAKPEPFHCTRCNYTAEEHA